MKLKKKNPSVAMSVLWGFLAAFAMTLLISGILAFLIAGEKTDPEELGVGVLITLLASSAAGSFLAVKLAGQKPLVVGSLCGAAYLLSLLSATALFFGGEYNGVLPGALVVLGGAMAAVLVAFKGLSGVHRGKKKYKIR